MNIKSSQPKKKPGRPPGQRYKGWKVVVEPTDCPFDERAFWQALEALAKHTPLSEVEETRPEQNELEIWAS